FCIASAVAFPRFILLLAVLVAFYSAVRFLLAGIANVMGLRKIRQWEKTEWCEVYQQTAQADALPWDAVRHVVIIPNYKEPTHILRRTLDYLSKQHGARDNMTVVLAMEAAEEGCIEKAQ